MFARVICGEGVPDFYAKEAIGNRTAYISETVDPFLQPVFDHLHLTGDMEQKGYTKDENGDYLISDCQKEFFADYYTSP